MADPGTGFLRGLRLLCFGRFSANPHHGRGTNLYLLPANRRCRVSKYRRRPGPGILQSGDDRRDESSSQIDRADKRAAIRRGVGCSRHERFLFQGIDVFSFLSAKRINPSLEVAKAASSTTQHGAALSYLLVVAVLRPVPRCDRDSHGRECQPVHSPESCRNGCDNTSLEID
jgi:hypothetical protein